MIAKVDAALPLATGVTEVGASEQPIVAFGEEQIKLVAALKLLTEVTRTVELVEKPAIPLPDAGFNPIVKSATLKT